MSGNSQKLLAKGFITCYIHSLNLDYTFLNSCRKIAGREQNMKKNVGRFGLVFLALAVFMVQGCAELDELRTANRRQAITVRDQMAELDKLRAELDAANKVNRVYEDRAQSDEEEKKRLHAELERLASYI